MNLMEQETKEAVPTPAEIVQAAAALAQVCDGAVEQDDRGYNGVDSPTVKSILRSQNPTIRQVRALWNILRKYRKQLEGYGFNYDLLVPPPLPVFVAQAATPGAPAAPYVPQKLEVKLLWADTDYGRRILVTSPYSPEVVGAVKKLEKRWFDKEGKNSAAIKNAWLIQNDVDAFDTLVGHLEEIEPAVLIEVAQDLKAAMEAAREAKRQAYAASRSESADLEVPTKLPPRPFQKAGIQYALDKNGRALIADEPGLGKTLQALGFLMIKKDALPALVICPSTLKPNWVGEAAKFTDFKCQILTAKSSLKSLRKAGFVANERPEPGYDLTIMNYDLLSCETVKTWVKMLSKGDSQYAHDNLIQAGRQAEEQLLKALAKRPGIEISNRLERVRKEISALGDKARGVRERKFVRAFANDIPIEEFLSLGSWKTLIGDELHRCKEQDAQCTMATQEISKRIENVLGLTGTPILNRPKEAWTQVNIVNPKVFPSFWDYAKKFCAAYEGRFGWDVSGSSNLEELERTLRTSVMVRRRKDQVLKELPPRIRITVPILIEKDKEYENATQDPLKKLALLKKEREEWKQVLSTLTPEERQKFISEHAEQASKAMRISGLALGEIEKVKQAVVKAKFSECVKFILNLQESAGKIIVFMNHHEFIDRMAEDLRKAELSVGVIDGRVNAADRHKVKTDFQEGDLQMLVGGIRAMSEGLTLTASHTVVFVELDWDPNRHAQAEARVDRLGQSEQTTMYYLVALGTLEEKISKMIDSKREVVNSALGEGDRTVSEDGILDSIIEDLLA